MDKTYYRIIDEKGNFVDEYSFQKESQGKGRKPKWYYYSETGYMSGRVLYCDINGNIQKILNYLIHMNEKLKQNKVFSIVPIDISNLKFDGEILEEELCV